MFTKFLLILSIVSMISCARETERSDGPIIVNPRSNAGKCLSKFGEYFSNYQEGKLSDEEVAKFWDCTASAVAEFSRLTTGTDSQSGNYSPAALWRFLHKYFLVGQTVDRELLVSIMELKQLMVGGTMKTVTKGELKRVIEFTEELKAITLELKPHIRVIVVSDETASEEQVIAAQAALARAMKRLATWIEQQKVGYSFAQMEKFVEGLARNSADETKWKKWVSAVKILSQAKGITVALPSEAILADQWNEFFGVTAQAYGLLLKYTYQVEGSLIKALASSEIREIAESVVGIFERGIGARGKSVSGIPLSEFEALFKTIAEAGWFPADIKKEALSEAFHWAVARLLTSEEDRTIPQIKDFNLDHVKALKTFFQDWRDLNAFSDKWPNGNKDSGRVKEFATMLKTSWPLLTDEYGRTVYPKANEKAGYDSTSLRVLGWQFLAIAMIRDSYVPDGKWEMETERMQIAVAEILPLIQNFNYLLLQKITVYKRLMKEGDLFMPGSDGNLLIGVPEGTHFLNGIVSALFSGNVWDSVVSTTCGTPANPSCYSDVVYQHREKIMGAMPRLKRMMDGKSLEEWREFFNKVQVTALGDVESKPWDMGDRTLVWMLLDYLENFVQKYDSNQNETISLMEAKVVYSTFEANLQKLFSPLGMPKSDVYPFFTFMMNYGETYFDRFGGQIEFIHWKHNPEKWQFESNRNTLVNILFELSKL